MVKQAPVIIEINLRLAAKMGVSFFRTASDAICTPDTIPSTCIRTAYVESTGIILFDITAIVDDASGRATTAVPAETRGSSSSYWNNLPNSFNPEGSSDEEQVIQKKVKLEAKEEVKEEVKVDVNLAAPVSLYGTEEDDMEVDFDGGNADQDSPMANKEAAEENDSSESESEGFKRPLPKELQVGSEQCPDCSAPFSLGMFICLSCGCTLQQQPETSNVSPQEAADRGSAALRKLACVSPDALFEVLPELRRTPFLSRTSRLRKALKDYDIGAVKGRKNR